MRPSLNDVTVRGIRSAWALASVAILAVTPAATEAETPVELVRPWIGSNNGRWFHVRSASRPYGMVALSPDTSLSNRWSKSGYVHESTTVLGFSHLHGWLLGGLLVMPVTGEVRLGTPLQP